MSTLTPRARKGPMDRAHLVLASLLGWVIFG